MWQNIIISCIIVACAFFLGRRIFRQLTGKQSGCSSGCKGCNDPAAGSDSCTKAKADFPKKTDG
ncbi:FeoB-associated Cys-rich membrane protein [Thiovibrio frasassiensis]|jgi:hypothetical protein|uniref:FeoB-associated Cys-rich membrane protein n=1 Tax=Thiovibrio frasassiensis TaxID=2984131 RepID=A0A9X4MF26_9BACT|nr:FeoB-associated Cys-rich membrane protein [Thiovibrio frasassiensis]MDG4475121.1 FeoB-associated Cys-rich membrane protein [Thiovibrio frasassiensis]